MTTYTLHEVSEYIKSLNRTSLSCIINELSFDEWQLQEVSLGLVDLSTLVDLELAGKFANQPAHTSPPIVLRPHPHHEGRWMVVDGNHRTFAGDIRGDFTIRAYVPKL